MAQQSYLEQIGIDEREKELVRGTYNENNEYSDTHKNALADGDEKGKGTGTPSTVLSLKDLKKNRYDQFSGWGETINTDIDSGAGGSYDKDGTKGVKGAFQGDAGRNYLLNSLNKYNEGNEYGQDSVDTTKQISGQYWVK